MGRKCVYNTDEEKKAAAALRAKTHYHKNGDEIRAARRLKYRARLVGTPRAKPPSSKPLTAEERKIQNNLKSKRSYTKHKSSIQDRRRAPRWRFSAVVEFDTGTRKSANEGRHDQWKERIQAISSDIEQAFGGKTPVQIALEQAKAFGTNFDRDALTSTRERFEGIVQRIDEYKHDVLNALGAGGHLGEVEKLCGPVSNVIWLLWDVEGGIIQEMPIEDIISRIERGRLILRSPDM